MPPSIRREVRPARRAAKNRRNNNWSGVTGGGHRRCDHIAVAVAPDEGRCRREVDDGTAVSVAPQDEVVGGKCGGILGQQQTCGVESVGDRERTARAVGRLGETEVSRIFLGRRRPEGDVL